MLKKLFVALALACAISATAQTTTVIGTFKGWDGTLVSSGQLQADLIPGIDTMASGFARFSGQTVTCGFNSASVATNQAVRAANSVTISGLTGHTFIVNDLVQVASMTDSTFNGTFTITGTTATSITYSQTATNATSGGGTLFALRASSGSGACTVATNTAMQPSGTSWKFCSQPSFISPGSCFVAYATGGTLDLTSTPALPNLTPAYNIMDLFSNQTVAGNKTFTGVTTFSGNLTLTNLTLGGNESIGGTLAVSGATTLANTTIGSANTLSANTIRQQAGAGFVIADPLGVSHFFISNGSPYTNSFVNGNGAGVVFLGSAAKTSVADTSGNIVTAGNITLQTTSQTLPAVISNDTAGGVAISNNAGKALQFDNSTNVLFPGSTSGNTIVKAPAVASGTLTLPAATDTLVGKATTDTFTNKTVSDTFFIKRLRATQGTALVTGDVGSLANFGTTASVSAVSGTDAAGSISIASAGTGQAANGTFTLTFHDGTWTNSPICTVSRGDGQGPNSAPAFVNSISATTLSIGFAGAAVAGTTYIFYFQCIGK